MPLKSEILFSKDHQLNNFVMVIYHFYNIDWKILLNIIKSL